MSTLKRKKGAGGVSETDSSGDESRRLPEPKKTFRPFTVSQMEETHPSSGSRPPALSKSQSGAKSSLATPIVRQSSKVNPKANVPPTPRDTPSLGVGLSHRAKDNPTTNDSDNDTPSLLDSPIVSMRQKAEKHPTLSSDDQHPRLATTVASRPRVQLEREVNSIRSGLEDVEVRVSTRIDKLEDRQTHTEEKQDVIIGKLDDLFTLLKTGTTGASTTSASSASREEKPKMVNPPPNPDHKAIAEAIQGRRDRDKTAEGIPSKFLSQAQKLARTVARSLLDEEKLSSGEAERYYTSDGQPDFFPAQFTKDGYCRPFPHPDLTFARNSPWFSTYIDLHRNIAPDDGSDFAKVCKDFTDRQILVLLHDGPFSTMTSGYRKRHPPDDTVSETDELARRRQATRLEMTTFNRQSYRPEAKAIAGPKYNAVWSWECMSRSNTDSEGGLIVGIPVWRAGWVTNAYRRMDSATRAVVLAKAGPHRPLPKTTYVKVPGLPPTIYTGKGKDRKRVRIPLAMISQYWLENPDNASWVEESPHIVDSSLKHRPDLSEFFDTLPEAKEPQPNRGYEAGDEGEDEDGAGVVGGLAGAELEDQYGDWSAAPGQIEEDEGDIYADEELVAAPVAQSQPTTSAQPPDNLAIDPAILVGPSGARTQARPRMRAPHDPATDPLTYTQPGSAAPVGPSTRQHPVQMPPQPQIVHSGHPPYSFREPSPPTPEPGLESEPEPATSLAHVMPVPPSLSQQERDAAAKAAAAKAAIPAPKPTNKKKPQVAGGPKAGASSKQVGQAVPGASTSTAAGAVDVPGVPVKRGRGRPKGSLNKKTIAKREEDDRLAAEAKERGKEEKKFY